MNRESAVAFDEGLHKYRILTDPDHEYISVTTWIGTFFEPFNADKILAKMRQSSRWAKGPYVGMTDDEIKKQWDNKRNAASYQGTQIHNDIDYSMRQAASIPSCDIVELESPQTDSQDLPRNIDKSNPSWKIYERFLAEHPDWTSIKTEWRIFDEDSKVAGTIDALFQNAQGDYILVDWKRAKKINRNPYGYDFATPWPICQLANSNYNHYCLQLNIYRYIIEKHYGLKIKSMFIAVLHPDYEPDNDRWLEIPDLTAAVAVLASHRKFQQDAKAQSKSTKS